MDFDDLDAAEEAAGGNDAPQSSGLEPELQKILEDTGTPEAFRGYLLEQGWTSCASVCDGIKGSDRDLAFEVEQLGKRLSPPATDSKELMSIRNAWRRCKASLPEPEGGAEGESKSAEAVSTGENGNAEKSWDGGDLPGPYAPYMDYYVHRMMTGQVTGKAPGRPEAHPDDKVDKGFEAQRKAADENRDKLSSSGIKPLSPFKKMTMNDLEKLCSKVLNGEMYGLPVPVNLDDLKKRGEQWLTNAFRASGIIGKDNSVKKILEFKRLPMTGKDAAGGSGPKAFITVQWEKEDPSLHKELFCKMPWDMGKEGLKMLGGETKTPEEQKEFYRQKEKGIDPFYRWKCSATIDYEAQESTIYRFLGPIFPFKIPKYYFADICRDNTNYILITEKIAYPKKGTQKDPPSPYEILPVAEKYFDFQLPPRMRYEMYYAIMRCQARMAAWDKLGLFEVAPPEMRGMGMAPPPLGTFPWPIVLTEKRRATKVKHGESVAKLWQEWILDKGKNCYEEKYRDTKFLDAVCNVARDYTGYKDDVFMYSCLFPDMIAFQHTNLQSDNAYYWYTDEDTMDAGLIDWGGASPGSFAQRMQGSITSAEGYILAEHEEGFLRCFINEYYKECGIKLDYSELWRQWMLSYCNYIYSMGSNIEMEIFRETPREAWKDVKNRWDDKAAGRWNVRCYVFMIGSALEYLHTRWTEGGKKRLHCHDVFLDWKAYWEGKGMV